MFAPRRVVLLAVGFGVANVAIVLAGVADPGALCDDAFYYFQIARHAAHGNGFSFDGAHVTNGFHPLLAWLAVPVFYVLDDPWLPIRVIQIVLVLATTATGVLLYRVGRAVRDVRTGELAAALFYLSPFTWILPQRGCEGALSMLAIAAGAWWLAEHPRRVFVLGALLGLAMLARTENVLWAVVALAWLACSARSLRPALAAGAIASVVVTPWLVWNLLRFGTILQVSGAAKLAFRLHGELVPVTGTRALVANVARPFVEASKFVVGEEFRPLVWTVAFIAIAGALFAMAAIAGRQRRMPSVLVPLIAFATLHVAYYVFIQRSYYNWYFFPVVVVAALWQAERLAGTWFARVRVVAGIVVCAATLTLFVARYGTRTHAVEHALDARLALLAEVPPGSTVGAWNAGRIGYFGQWRRPDLRFVNLDCVVNNELFAARARYVAWVIENVDYVLEPPRHWLPPGVVKPVNGSLGKIVR